MMYQSYGYQGHGNQGDPEYGHSGYSNYYNQDRREAREQPQYHYQQGWNQGHHDQYQYGSRNSPIRTQNRYEALRDYRENDPSTSFLDRRRSERTPPQQDVITHVRSPNAGGDAEEDSRSKRKRE